MNMITLRGVCETAAQAGKQNAKNRMQSWIVALSNLSFLRFLPWGFPDTWTIMRFQVEVAELQNRNCNSDIRKNIDGRKVRKEITKHWKRAKSKTAFATRKESKKSHEKN
jgi:hypothetical protein